MERELSARSKAIPHAEVERALQNRSVQLKFKRLIDIAITGAAFLVLSPLLLLIAVAVRLSSRGPIIFSQPRCGLHGNTFTFYKFRTMRMPSEWPPGWKLEDTLTDQGVLHKKRNDVRITSIGRFLRRCSLDELPQLYNVLIGDMSLIGPRPLIPEMSYAHPEFHKTRHLLRPGISGLWQIRHRDNGTSAYEMVDDDIEYLQRFSLKLDTHILMQTLPLLLGDDNAF